MSKTRILIQALGKALEKVPEKIGTLPSEEELIKQGFDPKTFYHGGPVPDIQQFVPQSRNRTAFAERSTNKGAPATFFSESEGYVETFAKQGGRPFFDENLGMMNYEPSPSARIYPVKLKLTNVFNYRNKDHVNQLYEKLGIGQPKDFEPPVQIGTSGNAHYDIKIGDPFTLQVPEISNAIKELGFTGYFTNETDRFRQRTVGLFYPEKGDVRSVFAKFDPDKAESGNIYATIIPPVTTAVGLGALAGLEEST